MATAADFEAHRVALTGHCYRMLGSATDADDAVQETMIRAWRGFERFDQRASLRTWLYRIATNVCLDALSERKRRARPMDESPAAGVNDELHDQPRTHWLEPVPDARVLPNDVNPSEQVILRQSVRLAFTAALQRLPARQRAALLLADVLGFAAEEIATTLEMSVAAVNSALQRARATLSVPDGTGPSERALDGKQAAFVTRYVEAFERYDVGALTALMHEDAVLNMPPFSFWLQGHGDIRAWMLGRGSGCRGSRLLRVHANDAPAFAQYRPSATGSGHEAWALIVLELAGERIATTTSFLDTETLFPLFGLPRVLRE
jgi:RNA polymerase sigma-70 factor (ECF subfamily)